jgi:DNA-binding response OmpR family regulator
MGDESAIGRPPVVLIAEDDDDGRDLYVLVLERAGFLAYGATSLENACAILHAIRVDVLVADFALPDGTGADLLRRSPTARPKVCILLTGFHADDVDTTGFDVVLKKPIPATDLLEVIRARM